jgi:FMN-dependent NADH-azoreductase
MGNSKMTKNDALDLFVEYLGQQDDFETEWNIFQDYLETEETLTEDGVKEFLDILIEGLNEDDKEPNKRLKTAIDKALAVANS